MPPINPHQLLKALGPLLSDTGGIKGAKEALKIVSLMKDASKLVTRCVYLNILRATESEDAFTKFMSEGGWDVLNAWLDVARSENNWPLLGELLEVYLRMPVTVSVLKQNTAAKTIKKMQAKTEDDKIKTLSTQLVDVWMKIIRGQNNGTTAEADSDDKKKKSKHSEKEKDPEKEKNHKDHRRSKDEKENSDRHKNRDRDSKDSNDADRKDRDRHKDKDRSRRDKDKSKSESSSKSSSSSSSSSSHKHKDSSSLSSSSRKSSEDKDTKPTLTSSNSSSAADKSKEEEARKRPKTVKMIGSRIRSTGLFEDDDDEEEKDAVRKPGDKLATKRSSIDQKGSETAEKKPRLHLNMPPPYSSSSVTPASTTPPEVMHGRIKIIPAKKAPAHEIQESNGFMDALESSTYTSTLGMKKKKKLTSPSVTGPPGLLKAPLSTTSPLTATTTTPGGLATSPTRVDATMSDGGPLSPPLLSPTTAMAQKLPSVPSFYRDTLEETPEKDEKKDDNKEEDKDSPPVLELMRPIETEQEKKPEQKSEQESLVSNSEPQLDFDNAEDEQDFNMEAEPARPSKPKKKVTWARESQMEQVFYFELDENERENVNRPKSFSDLKREEMMLDKRAMDAAKRFSNDTMVEVLPWKLPKLIDNAIQVVESGCNSVERQIQLDREQSVLCALFFNKVPDTPNEPDAELAQPDEEMKIIPLEDENGSCTEYTHTYNFQDPTSLPYDPEFGALPLGGPMQQQQPQQQQPSQPGPLSMGGGHGGGHNLPPAISHILNVLQQQAQETRDPVMQNLQAMLTNVLQTTNPQDNALLVNRILGALEPFMNQIPGLSGLVNSLKANGGLDMGGGRFMGGPPPGIGGPMGGNPRHGLLGSAPPGFNMDGGATGGNMRQHGPGMMNNGGGNFYMERERERGGGGDRGMHMGGPPHNYWRGGRDGGRSRPFKRSKPPKLCIFYAKHGNCRNGENCQFLHADS